jgi:hypothetical protein
MVKSKTRSNSKSMDLSSNIFFNKTKTYCHNTSISWVFFFQHSIIICTLNQAKLPYWTKILGHWASSRCKDTKICLRLADWVGHKNAYAISWNSHVTYLVGEVALACDSRQTQNARQRLLDLKVSGKGKGTQLALAATQFKYLCKE